MARNLRKISLHLTKKAIDCCTLFGRESHKFRSRPDRVCFRNAIPCGGPFEAAARRRDPGIPSGTRPIDAEGVEALIGRLRGNRHSDDLAVRGGHAKFF